MSNSPTSGPVYVLWIRKFLRPDHVSELTYLEIRKISIIASSRRGAGWDHSQILHTAPQTRLYALGLPSKQPHDQRPTNTGKYRPPSTGNPRRNRPPHDFPFLSLRAAAHTQFCEGQGDSGKHVDDDLLVDAALGSAAKDDVAAEESGDEGVCGTLFAVVELGERVHGGFVERDEEREVLGVGACGGENCGEFLPEAGGGGERCCDWRVEEKEGGGGKKKKTYVPSRKRNIITSACGKRTLAPYTRPFRRPLTMARTSWFLGSSMNRFTDVWED